MLLRRRREQVVHKLSFDVGGFTLRLFSPGWAATANSCFHAPSRELRKLAPVPTGFGCHGVTTIVMKLDYQDAGVPIDCYPDSGCDSPKSTVPTALAFSSHIP